MENFFAGALVVIAAVWSIIFKLLSLVFGWVFDNWRVTVGIWAVLVLMALWEIRKSIDAKGTQIKDSIDTKGTQIQGSIDAKGTQIWTSINAKGTQIRRSRPRANTND